MSLQPKFLNGSFVSQEKQCTDCELIKSCLIAANTCPEKIKLLKTTSFLAKTVAGRVEDIGNNLGSQLKTRPQKRQIILNGFPWLLMD